MQINDKFMRIDGKFIHIYGKRSSGFFFFLILLKLLRN